MRVYIAIRNASELEERLNILNELTPLQFQVFMIVYVDMWASEEQLILRTRQHYNVLLKRVSDRKITETLLELYKLGFVRKEDIETDLEEDYIEPLKIEIAPLNGPQGCGVFS